MPIYFQTLNICKIVVISFSNRANPFHWSCLFSIFIGNKIYIIEIEIEIVGPAVMVREHRF